MVGNNNRDFDCAVCWLFCEYWLDYDPGSSKHSDGGFGRSTTNRGEDLGEGAQAHVFDEVWIK